VVLAAVLVGLVGCTADAPGHDAGDGGGVDAGDGALPDVTVPDAWIDGRVPDGQVPPDVVQYDFCDEPYFKLPIDGQTEYTSNVAIQGGRVAISKRPANELMSQSIYVLDLESCLSKQITQGFRTNFVSIMGDEVVWDDFKDYEYGVNCTDLYRHDLTTAVTEPVTQTPYCETDARTNGRHIVFQQLDTLIDPRSLHVLDRQTDLDLELAPVGTSINSYDLNDRYVVWAGYTGEATSIGRDVFWHDLASGETNHIDATYPRYQEWVFVWEDWVTIRGTDAYQTGPSYLEVYRLSTQETIPIVADDSAVSAGWIQGGLVFYNTSAYTGTANLNPSDIEVFSVDSLTTRRLTTTDSNLRVTAVALPFLVIIHRLFLTDRFQNDYYLANLEALGVLDASGVLIPGDPVIIPPE
jgi:hypothetical protein